MKTRDDHDLHVALEMVYMALDGYDDPRERFFEAMVMVCERVAAQTVLLVPDESPVRMVLLAHRACLTSPLMDIVIGRGEG